MARSFEFSVLRLMPDPARGEMVNLGIVIFHEGEIEIRLGEVMTRARLFHPDFTPTALHEGVAVLKRLGAIKLSSKDRHIALKGIGPFALGDLGYFSVEDGKQETYEGHVSRLLRIFAGPVHAEFKKSRSISRLNTDVRKVFRAAKVLAHLGDAGAIEEHKIVPEWPIPTRPSLSADLALKNGIMRVCKIVDLQLNDEGHPPVSLFAGVVTLDVAKREANAAETVFAYRATGPSVRIDEALSLARIHATKLVDWEKTQERETFLHDWITAAKTSDTKQRAGLNSH